MNLLLNNYSCHFRQSETVVASDRKIDLITAVRERIDVSSDSCTNLSPEIAGSILLPSASGKGERRF